MEIQRTLGADIAMAFDECLPHDVPRAPEQEALRWNAPSVGLANAVIATARRANLLNGIGQGGSNPALREECAKALVPLEFDGYAIGGVSVGEPEHEMFKAVELAEPFLPAHKARYAMGLGTPAQLVELIARGVDMFDCVLPTRVARNGTVFTRKGTYILKNAENKMNFGPLEDGCECFACQRFTRSYLRHLYIAQEILSVRMLSVHNSYLFLKIMTEVRAAIANGTFGEFHREFVANYRPRAKGFAFVGAPEPPSPPPKNDKNELAADLDYRPSPARIQTRAFKTNWC